MGDCKTADPGCHGTTRAKCFYCGEHVCTNPGCSRVMPYRRYGRKRLCLDCVEMEARTGGTWALEELKRWHQDLLDAGEGGWTPGYLEMIEKAHDRYLAAQEKRRDIERRVTEPPRERPRKRPIPQGLPMYLLYYEEPGVTFIVATDTRHEARKMVFMESGDENWLDRQRTTIQTIGTSIYRKPRIIVVAHG